MNEILGHGTNDGRAGRPGAHGRLAALAMLATLCGPVAAAGPRKPACELLTVAEAAAAAGAAVTIKPDESGPDDRGGDNCVWTTADRRNVMIRILVLPSRDQALPAFRAELEQAFGLKRPPETIGGLADEARYRTYEGNLRGGVIIGRKDTVVFTVEGSASRDKLIDLVRLLLPRM